MYIERKGSHGSARIGRVEFSKTARSVYYVGRMLHKTKRGIQGNYFDAETGEEYWISGCKKKGGDRLFCGTVEIDDDVREEYWLEIRKIPEKKNQNVIRGAGKYTR
jgi:hypothetical protein